MIARLTAIYVAIFAALLATISAAIYSLYGQFYHSELLPALGTPEGQTAYANAMRHVLLAIAGADVPLLVAVGVLAYILAGWQVRPLIAAREREQRFAADAAHEMRSPLATIASVAQAARLGADEATVAALDTIARTALDASALIGDLLTLAREPRRDLLQREPVDLANVVTACARELQARAVDRCMGLSIASWVASAHGGSLALGDSKTGATFEARFPVLPG